MKSGEFWQLRHVSDVGIRRELSVLLAGDARTEARIVAHLAEVDRRKLYLKDGFSCLFKYCQGQLGLSESQAFHRMTAARIARRFPMVFGMIEQRRIHLSGLAELRDFITADNHRELLELSAGKSKRQIKELLAARFPGEAIVDAVRKLPAAHVAPLIAAAPPRGARTAVIQAGSSPLFDPVTGEVQPFAGETGASPQVSALQSKTEPPRALAAAPDIRYRIQFDAGSALKAKLELARALSSHSNPRGDLETLFERALDAYVEQLQKRRFAQVERPRAKKSKSAPSPNQTADAASEVKAPRSEQRAHLSHDTRRAVAQQGGIRCSFVAPNGQRCDEQAFLQFHHEQAWARWGKDDAPNLKLLCAGHNRLQAENDFGAEHVERHIEQARAGSGGGRGPERGPPSAHFDRSK